MATNDSTNSTPGPWVVMVDANPLYKGLIAIVAHNPDRLLAIGSAADRLTLPDEYMPNARLMAAAPALLAACEAALVATEDGRLGKCGFCLSDVYECDRFDTAATECAGWMIRKTIALATGNAEGVGS